MVIFTDTCRTCVTIYTHSRPPSFSFNITGMYLRRNLTFELDGEVIRVVEREHLFVGGLVIGVEREMCGEDKYGK